MELHAHNLILPVVNVLAKMVIIIQAVCILSNVAHQVVGKTQIDVKLVVPVQIRFVMTVYQFPVHLLKPFVAALLDITVIHFIYLVLLTEMVGKVAQLAQIVLILH